MRTPSALRRDGLAGVRVGHAASVDGSTGVSVVLFGQAAPTVVDVRGGASGTYDTASLSLDATFGRRWAVFFTGGSVFGLDAGRRCSGRGPRRGRRARVSTGTPTGWPRSREPCCSTSLARRRTPGGLPGRWASEAAGSAVPIAPFAGRVGAGRRRADRESTSAAAAPSPAALAIGRENDPGFGSVAVSPS